MVTKKTYLEAPNFLGQRLVLGLERGAVDPVVEEGWSREGSEVRPRHESESESSVEMRSGRL